MADPKETGWGAGRVAFVANLDRIKADVAKALPLTAIYRKYQADVGIGYATFCKMIHRYAPAELQAARGEGAPPRLSRARQAAPASLPPKPQPPASSEERPAHAGPADPFPFKPFVGPDDKERLIGKRKG